MNMDQKLKNMMVNKQKHPQISDYFNSNISLLFQVFESQIKNSKELESNSKLTELINLLFESMENNHSKYVKHLNQEKKFL